MDMSSTALNNNAINNLLNMNSTVSLVKKTAQEMIKDAQKSSDAGVIKKGSSQYKEEMDYNKDDEITISEKLRYYAEQTAKSLRKDFSSTKGISEMSKDDYEKLGMGGYYDAKRNLQYSKAISAYSYQNLIGKNFNNFTLSV